jgi:adenylylsulfate kinase
MSRIRKILIMGLPGSGKTTLARALSIELNAVHLNADEIRESLNDWDFSYEGRLRQAKRMKDMSDNLNSKEQISIADFVCPTNETRDIFKSDFTIFIDRINESKYKDTNQLFEKPLNFDVCIKNGLTLKEEINVIKEQLCRTLLD